MGGAPVPDSNADRAKFIAANELSVPNYDEGEMQKQKTKLENAFNKQKETNKELKDQPKHDEKALAELAGDEAKVANNWLNLDPEKRMVALDGLLEIQEKLKNAVPVDPKQLEAFKILEKVLPKVFGTTIDNAMAARKYDLITKMQKTLAIAEDQQAVKDAEKNMNSFLSNNE